MFDKEEFPYFIEELKREGDVIGILFAYLFRFVDFFIGWDDDKGGVR